MLNIIATLIQTALFTLNKVSQPSSTHIKDKQDFDLAHNRNKALILINLSASISFLLNLHLGIGKPTSNIQGLFGATFIITALLVTTWLNLHPLVFKIIFNLYALSFGFLLINNGEHGIIGTAVTAPLIPLVVYFLTGSIRGFIINIICEIIFMNVFCEKIMQKNLIQLSIEDTTRALIDFANQNFVYSFIYTAFIHYIIQNALYKIRQAEKKKDDFEKQKNFLLGFSHELRNLINSLMGNVKLASLENLPEKAKELLLNAEVCAEMLLHLVNNILDTGKVEIGELEITPVPTKVYDTIERIWSICSELIKRKNLRGTMKIHKHIPQLLTLDHYRIAQLFLNLIGNAVKYTDTGSVDVSVEWIDDIQAVNETCFEPFPYNYSDDDEGLFEKNQAVSIINHDFIILSSSRKKINRNLLARRANDKPGMLKISVSDTGCGILEEEIDLLFHRFTQGSSDPSKKKLGTGLGLFITKELCQKMNGDVKVFSKRGSGSTFIVCLPIQPVTKEQASSFELQDMRRISSYQKNLRAMVVDDEQFSHLILRNYLTKLHVEVVDVAENGLISYEMYKDRVARKDFVNIVTMDIQMPVMDGKSAAQKIREFEVANDVTPCLLVIVSGNCTESEIKECLDKNGNIRADAFVKKPVSVDELNRIITYHFAQVSRPQSVSVLHG